MSRHQVAALVGVAPYDFDSGKLKGVRCIWGGRAPIRRVLYMAALKRIPAGRAALLGLLEIVLGPIWVWLVDGERPGVLTLLGGVVVIGSAAANVWLDSRRPTG